MKFMNSNYGYANFAKGKSYDSPFGKSKKVTNEIVSARSRKAPTYDSPFGKGTPETQSKALANTLAKPELREPGVIRNAKSTAAGVSQGTRDVLGTQGKTGVKVKSTIAGLQQSGRDAVYAGGQTLKKAGRFIKNNKVGVGLAAAGALGAAGYGIIRKMRSDKGKKRGKYSN